MRPSLDELLSETARLAHSFHWPLDTILDLEHADRRRFLAEADALAGPEPVEYYEDSGAAPGLEPIEHDAAEHDVGEHDAAEYSDGEEWYTHG